MSQQHLFIRLSFNIGTGEFSVIFIVFQGLFWLILLVVKMKKIMFFIPGSIVPKARPKVTKNGTFMPPRYRKWRLYAEGEIHRQIAKQLLGPVLPIQRAALEVRLTGKHRMSADADNLIGSCMDALVAAGVFKNDNLTNIPEISFRMIVEGADGALIIVHPITEKNKISD